MQIKSHFYFITFYFCSSSKSCWVIQQLQHLQKDVMKLDTVPKRANWFSEKRNLLAQPTELQEGWWVWATPWRWPHPETGTPPMLSPSFISASLSMPVILPHCRLASSTQPTGIWPPNSSHSHLTGLPPKRAWDPLHLADSQKSPSLVELEEGALPLANQIKEADR